MYTGLELTSQQAFAPATSARATWKRRLKVFGVYLLFVNVFGTLIKSPVTGFYLIFGGYPMLFVDLAFFLVYFGDKILNKEGGFTSFEWFVMLMLTYVMLQAGFVTNFYFGQPVFMGMTAEKSWLAILISILFFYLLRIKAIDLTMIRDALLFAAWFHLPIFLVLLATLNPNHYAGTLFVYCNSVKGGCQFEFDIFPFAFASIYYFIRFVRTNKIGFGVIFIIFFAYIFFINQKRGTSLALAGTIGLYYVLNLKFDKIMVYAIGFVLFFISGITFLYFFMPDILARLQLQYYDVYQVLTGHEVAEASAQARVRESAIAFKYFNQNDFSWVFGNGKINNDWSGHPIDLYHYYPSDIGILGIVWQFGVVGLLLGLTQYLIVLQNHIRIKSFKQSSFYQAVLYFILFFFIRGIPTGGSWFDPGIAIGAVFVGIHYFFYYVDRHPERGYVKPI